MKRAQGGFSLIEVLVTLAIVAIALLGLLAVQARAFSMQADTFNQRAAVELVAQMRERISANYEGFANAVKTGGTAAYTKDFNPGAGIVIPTCIIPDACTADDEVPNQLIGQWAALAQERLPGAVGAIAPIVSPDGTFAVSITVGWIEPLADSDDPNCNSLTYVAGSASHSQYRCLQLVAFPG